MRALILYSQLAGYFYDCLQILSQQTEINNVLVIAHRASSIAPFQFTSTQNIKIIYHEDYSKIEIDDIATSFQPDIVYLSGWSSPQYLMLGRKFKKLGLPVVMGLDNQWSGTFRQKLAQYFFPLVYRRASTHIWVAGTYQYEFARRLRYNKRQILFNLYSANVPLFMQNIENSLIEKNKNYPKIILFIGRFIPDKGVPLLVDTFINLQNKQPNDWQLWLVGNGPLKDKIQVHESIKVMDFVQPNSLPQLMHQCGVFCLPSNFENWGVVIHEAAAAGLPLLISDACGATTAFAKHNYNGFIFKSGDSKSLSFYLQKVMSTQDETFLKMARRSANLSQQITPQVWAATFSSLLDGEKTE